MASPQKLDIDALLAPIPGDKPAGIDLTYEPVFDQIKQARKATDKMAKGDWEEEEKVSDWRLVEQLAVKALKEKSKDLQLAGWLTEAAANKYGFPGLRDGLRLMKGLIEKFWDGLWPAIEDGDVEPRAAPLNWLGEKFAVSVRQIPLTKGAEEREYSCADWDRVPVLDQNIAKVPADQKSELQEEKAKLVEKLEKAVLATTRAYVEELVVDSEDAWAAMAELEKLADEKFGGDAVSLMDLKKAGEAIKQRLSRIVKTKREQEPGGDESAGEASQSAGQEGSSEEATEASAAGEGGEGAAKKPARKKGSLAAEPESREDAVARVISAAAWLRQNEPSGPAGYLLLRALRFGEYRAGGSTPDAALAEPPPTEVRQKLRALFTEGNWQGLLDEAEAAAGSPAGRAWLDVQRFSHTALYNLSQQAAADALKSELRAYLTDYASLLESELSDGTPAAGNETRKWIEEAEILPKPAASPEPAAAPEPPPTSPDAGAAGAPAEPDAWEVAKEHVRAKRPQKAFELIREKVNAAQTGRDRFYRKLQLAELCLMTDKRGLAVPVLEELAAEIDRYHLEDWETKEWSARVWGALYRCYKGTSAAANGYAEKAQQAYSRLCRLDITQAMAYGE